jgi:hypothetical protein
MGRPFAIWFFGSSRVQSALAIYVKTVSNMGTRAIAARSYSWPGGAAARSYNDGGSATSRITAPVAVGVWFGFEQ